MIVYKTIKFLIWAAWIFLTVWFVNIDAGSSLWKRCVVAGFALLGVYAFIVVLTVIFYADEKEKNERS